MPEVLVQKQIRTETAILRQLERKLRPQARREFQKTVEKFRDQLSIKAIADAFEAGGPNAVEDLIDLGELNEKITASMTPVYAAGIALGIKRLAPSFRKSLRGALPKLRQVNIPIRTDTPSIRRFTQQSVGSLITTIDPTNRRAVRSIALRAAQRGEAPRDAAKLIRNSVGLRPDQVNSIDKFREKLKEQGVTGARQDKLVENLSRRKIRERSTLIANTEMSKVTSQSQLAMADQAAEQGLVSRDNLFKQWITTPGTPDDSCDEADGQVVKLDELFDVGEFGSFTAPPAHPGCYMFDTEILTVEDGWVRIDKLNVLKSVYAVDLTDMSLAYTGIKKIVTFPIPKMIWYHHGNIDLAVTHNHKHVVTQNGALSDKAILLEDTHLDIGYHIMSLEKEPSHSDILKPNGLKIKHIMVNDCRIEIIRGRHRAYGVELEKYHTLIVRRNGKMAISGNCLCEIAFLTKES